MEYQHSHGGSHIEMANFTYAGWNTNGNTLGTVISNSILLYLFKKGKENTLFNSLRILEDNYFQAILRQYLEIYVNLVHGDSPDNLATDLTFYERFVYKVLNSNMQDICDTFSLPWKLESAYFPWNRTFEIGLIAH